MGDHWSTVHNPDSRSTLAWDRKVRSGTPRGQNFAAKGPPRGRSAFAAPQEKKASPRLRVPPCRLRYRLASFLEPIAGQRLRHPPRTGHHNASKQSPRRGSTVHRRSDAVELATRFAFPMTSAVFLVAPVPSGSPLSRHRTTALNRPALSTRPNRLRKSGPRRSQH